MTTARRELTRQMGRMGAKDPVMVVGAISDGSGGLAEIFGGQVVHLQGSD